jgi:hypothetical protein
MQQFCQYGSVRGATGNRRPYRDIAHTLFSFPSNGILCGNNYVHSK